MAKINVTYDTVSKMCEATIDGTKISDMTGCSLYHSYDSDDEGNPKFALSLVSTKYDKDNKMVKQEYIQANLKDVEDKSAEQTKVAKDICDFLSSYKRGK
jgi:hypothetical protein